MMTKLVVFSLLVATALVTVSAAVTCASLVSASSPFNEEYTCNAFCEDDNKDAGKCINGNCMCRTGSTWSGYVVG
ncbi:hypothetical protein DPMN_130091 [Dreissena polymorpha]|uniref:Uncharacterized protein n=1 Tax=Dreissena polymorpha TaxID=45954 RepID=A0A9D4JYV5_DREPO|nr:hypothetical protein DPMN_130091 [Dreissena polymorpha]